LIQHIVLLKWKPGTSEQQIERAFDRAHSLVEIDGVERITLGRNRTDDPHGFTHALIVRLIDEEALMAYLENAERRRYVSEVLGAIEADRIEVDVPEDAHIERRSASLRWDWAGMRPSASAAAAALRWEETHADD
jgi:Stress responsive A/B Barrel Domain